MLPAEPGAALFELLGLALRHRANEAVIAARRSLEQRDAVVQLLHRRRARPYGVEADLVVGMAGGEILHQSLAFLAADLGRKRKKRLGRRAGDAGGYFGILVVDPILVEKMGARARFLVRSEGGRVGRRGVS